MAAFLVRENYIARLTLNIHLKYIHIHLKFAFFKHNLGEKGKKCRGNFSLVCGCME